MSAPPCGHPYDAPPVLDCPVCQIRDVPDNRARWTSSPAPGPCAHLGPPTGDLVECATCAGRVRLKVLACAVFGSTLERLKLPGLACCIGCNRYLARPDNGN